MSDAKPESKDEEPGTNVQQMSIAFDELGSQLQFALQPGKNKLVVRLRPIPYRFSV